MRIIYIAALLGFTLASPGQAGTPVPVKMTCPVGGESFTHVETMSLSRWGSRPDGKPYGSWTFPMPLPECPGNGLVVYKEFSKAEVGRLAPLIASPAYQALRGETPYYRAAWLTRTLDQAKPLDVAWLTLQASWEADGAPNLKARYQREFADALLALPLASGDEGRTTLQARAANALRELGEFDRAAKFVGLLRSEAEKAGKPEDQNDGLIAYLKDLDVLIARRDASSEPLDMIPVREAASRCMEMQAATADEPHCRSENVKKQIEFFRKMEAAMGKSRP